MSFVSLVLKRRGPLHEPVSLAQALSRRGFGLRKAHDVLNRLAAGESVSMRLPASEELAGLRVALAAFGVEAQPRQVPETVGVQALGLVEPRAVDAALSCAAAA